MAELLALQDKISLENNKRYENTMVRVLIDGYEIRDSRKVYSSRTLTNKLVYFESNEVNVGEFVDIIIEKACPYHLMGRVEKRN